VSGGVAEGVQRDAFPPFNLMDDASLRGVTDVPFTQQQFDDQAAHMKIRQVRG
jgi:hypothetical protein